MATALEARLGPIERVHRARRSLRRGQLYGAVVLIALAIVAWSVAAIRGFVAYTEYGPLLVARWVTVPQALGMILAALGLWLGWKSWRSWRLRVRVHANGVAIVRGRRGRAVTWAEVRALWSRAVRTGLPGLTSARRMRLELEASDGRRLRLDDSLEDFEVLSHAVKSHVFPLLLAGYTRSFNDRQVLTFGPIRLGPSGIEDGRRPPYGWSEVRGAQLASGRLQVQTSRPGRRSTLTYPAHRIPNVELCAQLIQEIGQIA